MLTKIKELYFSLTKFEKGLWLVSVLTVVCCFLLSGGKDILSAIASLIGVTALVFVAKGYAVGQILTVVFALFYGFISFFLCYYGEMITYLGMSAPIAAASAVEWLRNPYKGTREVKIRKMTFPLLVLICSLSAVVTLVFYYILKFLGNANLFFSTLSVATSFLASALTFLRSPYYAIAYAANDIVLIILWVLASVPDISYAPMAACFVMFLVNDLYGFYNWRKMAKRQKSKS